MFDLNKFSSLAKNNAGTVTSLGLHFMVIVMALVGLPHCHRKDMAENLIIPIEVVSIKDISNIQTQDTKPLKDRPTLDKPKPADEPQEADKKENKEQVPLKPKEEKPKKDDTKAKVKDKPKKDETKKPNKDKQKDDKKDKKKKKKQTLENLLKNLEEFNTPDQKVIDEKIAKGTFDPSKELSIKLSDLIFRQIKSNWNQPLEAVEVVIEITILPDGTLENPKISAEHSYNKNEKYFDISSDEAIRAVYKTGKIENIPPGEIKEPITLGFRFIPDIN